MLTGFLYLVVAPEFCSMGISKADAIVVAQEESCNYASRAKSVA